MNSNFLGWCICLSRPSYDYKNRIEIQKETYSKIYTKRHTAVSAAKQLRFWNDNFVKNCELLDEVPYTYQWIGKRNDGSERILTNQIVIKKVYGEAFQS